MTKSKSGYKIRKDGKKDTGRPTKFTPETINKLENAFSLGCSDLEACLYADVSPSAFYRFQDDNPDFKERKDVLKKKMIFKARINLKEALESKDERTKVDASKWLLERKCRDEFSTRVENEVTLTMTDEEVNEVEAFLFGFNQK